MSYYLLRIAVWLLVIALGGPLVATPFVIKDRVIKVDGYLGDWADVPAAVEDDAGDAYSEAPDLQTVKLAADGQQLFVLVQANYAPQRAPKTDKWHHADSSLTLQFEGSNTVPWTVQVRGTANGIEVTPATVAAAVADGAVELAVPLELVKDNPLRLIVRSSIIYFASEQQAGYEGSDRLPDSGALTILVQGVAPDTTAPTLAEARVENVGAEHATVLWQTQEAANTELVLTTEGQPATRHQKPWLRRDHHVYLRSLQPSITYTASLTSTDLAGNTSLAQSLTFTTLESNPSVLELGDCWLHVEGRYIADATGTPFKLAGYGQSMRPCYTAGLTLMSLGNFGDWAEFAKRRGMNAFRIGLSPQAAWEGVADADFSQFTADHIEQVLDPQVQALKRNGMYAVIDLHDIWKVSEEEWYRRIIPFWEAVARRYCHEPWVAIYELYNEPYHDEVGLSPAAGPIFRRWFRDCIQAIRAIDTRHIIMVSDWNAGWGAATESMWAPIEFRPDEPYDQVVFSKHIAKDHCTTEFLTAYVDDVSEKWDVPIVVGEFELGGEFMDEASFRLYQEWLRDNPGNYGWFGWSMDHAAQWAQCIIPFFWEWASRVPGFPPTARHILEDFDGPDALFHGSWEASGGSRTPVNAKIIEPGCEGWGQALEITFGPSSERGEGNWAAVWTPWAKPSNWADLQPDRITMVLRGDGSATNFDVRLGSGRFQGGEHKAEVSLADPSWHPVVLRGTDFTPPVNDFSTIVRIAFHAGYVPQEATLTVDRILLERPLTAPLQ